LPSRTRTRTATRLLVANTAGLEYNPFLYKELPYDPRKYRLVTRLVQVHEMLVVSAALPVKSFKEFLEYAKKNDKLFYSSPTIGSPEHIGMESIKVAAGFKMEHVPYKGMAAALQGVLTGSVQGIVTSALSAGPHMTSGKLRPLAISGEKRSAQAPDTPTFRELGYPDITLGYYLALAAPGGTPIEIANKIAADVKTVLHSPEFQERFVKPFEYYVVADTPAEFEAYFNANLPKSEKRVKDSGASLN
jgi:tripartite-type tricarboxylate transporter receptor subunit TctC